MHSKTKTVRTALDELINSLGIQKKLREYDALVFWETVVGDHIAKVTTVKRITQGVLFVKVKTSTWRNELSLQKKNIVERLNATLGDQVVKDIKFQ